MFNLPFRIPGCDSHSPDLLSLFLSSDAITYSTMTFSLLGISDHVTVSVSIDFPSNSKGDAPFHHIVKKLHALLKQKTITSQKLGSREFWQIAYSVLNKGKSAIPPLVNCPEVLSSALDEVKLFAENFFKNSNLDDSDISLPVSHSRSSLKLHNISVTPKLVIPAFIRPRSLVLIVFQLWF